MFSCLEILDKSQSLKWKSAPAPAGVAGLAAPQGRNLDIKSLMFSATLLLVGEQFAWSRVEVP